MRPSCNFTIVTLVFSPSGLSYTFRIDLTDARTQKSSQSNAAHSDKVEAMDLEQTTFDFTHALEGLTVGTMFWSVRYCNET